MLKLLKSQIPEWVINWTNVTFTLDRIIWNILSIYVDWEETKGYNIENNRIILDVAPNTSVEVNYFYREVAGIQWDGTVTLWDLKMAFYSKIGRVNADWSVPQNINKLYPEDYVKEQLRKSYKRIVNKWPEKLRIQQYTTRWINWYRVSWTNSENSISFDDSLNEEIEGMFFVWDGVAYDYYRIEDWVFQVKNIDISEVWDKVIIGSKVPFWVQKISGVYSSGVELDYLDEREFNMNTEWFYTIVKDWQGRKYIILPYSEDEKITVVKYIAEVWHMSDEDDIIDIVEEYSDVIVYDTAYRLLMDKEDERWMTIKAELWNWKKEWLLYEYQAFVKSETKKSRIKIWITPTFRNNQY